MKPDLVNSYTKKGSSFFQYLALFSGSFSIICSGMHYGWPSPSLPKLHEDNSTVSVSNDEGSWISVMPMIGSLCGSALGTLILDMIGRKGVVLLSCLPFLAAWLMLAFAKSVLLLMTARFIAGISDGLACTAIPIYLGEISDPGLRGSMGSSVSMTRIFGTLVINVIGSHFSIRTTALISSIVPVMCFLTFWWMPESPYYFIIKNNFKKAERSLKIFKGTPDVEWELNRLVKAVKQQTKNTGKFLDLFTVYSNRKALFVIMVLRGTQQLSGSSAITFYAQTIFHEIVNVVSPAVASQIYFAVQLSVCCCCCLVVDKVGRRPLLIISVIGSAIALFVEGLYFYFLNATKINVSNFTWIPFAALVVYVVIFSIGMQSIPTLMLGELFQTNVKAFALTFSDIYYSATAIAAAKFFQTTRDSYGLQVPFLTFTVCGVLGLVFIILFVPETKGKTLEQIQDNFRGSKNAANSEGLQEF